MKSHLALSVLGLLPGVFSLALRDPVEAVKTTSGTVHGHVAKNTSGGVMEYLGIPFAVPPVGPHRWTPPQPFHGSSVIDGTKYGPSCPAQIDVTPSIFQQQPPSIVVTPQGEQVMLAFLAEQDVTYSEDCLNLNVWTRSPRSQDKKAVLVWIHGGAFTSGTANIAGYSGKHLADLEDVVVVGINYRLGIFGFPGGPALSTNLGLLDVRVAVEWIRDNIASFGGDPDRITLFGQSAGGSAIDHYAYAFPNDPIAAGFISQSGNVFSVDGMIKRADARKAWYNVTETVGCGDQHSDDDKVLKCMRSKSWQDVQDAQPVPQGFGTSTFGPTVDESLVFSDYIARSVAGKVARRPLLIGNNINEAALFKPILAAQGTVYPEAYWDYLQFVFFTCSTSQRALASVGNKVPTWRYRYFGDFPNIRLTTTPPSLAWHGAEIPLIMGTDLDVQNVLPRTAAQERITSYLRKAWVAFAKDPSKGLDNYGFPRYSPLKPSLVRLAYDNQTGPQPAFPEHYDTGCVIATALAELVSKAMGGT